MLFFLLLNLCHENIGIGKHISSERSKWGRKIIIYIIHLLTKTTLNSISSYTLLFAKAIAAGKFPMQHFELFNIISKERFFWADAPLLRFPGRSINQVVNQRIFCCVRWTQSFKCSESLRLWVFWDVCIAVWWMLRAGYKCIKSNIGKDWCK